MLLRALLFCKESPPLTVENLKDLVTLKPGSDYLELLYQCEKKGLIQLLKVALKAPDKPLEEILPNLLKILSQDGCALLSDGQGFNLASSGFSDEVVEELSALSADIANIHQRRSKFLEGSLGEPSQAWSIVNAAGYSRIGFWPLFIGANRFVLVLSGKPQLKCSGFVTLVWSLNVRYGQD